MTHHKQKLRAIILRQSWLLFSGVLLLVATDSHAQPMPQPQLVPTPRKSAYDNLVRVPIGVSFYNSGWYNCAYAYPYYACGAGNYTDYIPFTTGVQVELHLAGNSYLTPGFQFMTGSVTGTYYNGYYSIDTSSHENLWEPTLDYVAKGTSDSDEISGRFRVGLGGYIGSDSHTGVTFRLGGGGSLFNGRKVGLGLDVVFEAGSYHGYWIGGLQLLISPEFRF